MWQKRKVFYCVNKFPTINDAANCIYSLAQKLKALKIQVKRVLLYF